MSFSALASKYRSNFGQLWQKMSFELLERSKNCLQKSCSNYVTSVSLACFYNCNHLYSRLIKKRFFGSLFNVHYAIFFIMKGLLLPLSIAVHIALLQASADQETELYCIVMRTTWLFGASQTAILTLNSFIFRLY